MQVFGIGHSLPRGLLERRNTWFRWYRRSVLRQIEPDVKPAQVRSHNRRFVIPGRAFWREPAILVTMLVTDQA
jgi:hypothetical protein